MTDLADLYEKGKWNVTKIKDAKNEVVEGYLVANHLKYKALFLPVSMQDGFTGKQALINLYNYVRCKSD